MSQCQACKHFTPDDDGQPDGWCDRIKVTPDTAPRAAGEAAVWIDNPDHDGTALSVSPTFGCVLWERRKSQPSA